MANLNTMYPGVAFSPDTYLKEPLASGGSILYVIDGLVFGNLPTLATIGEDQNAETIMILAKRTDNGFDITRAIEGTARDWIKGSTVARNFTNKDYETLIKNIEKLNNEKLDKNSNIAGNPVIYDSAILTPGEPNPTTLIAWFMTLSDKFNSYLHKSAMGNTVAALDTNKKVPVVQLPAEALKDTTYTAGTNVTINSSNQISATDTTYGLATTSSNGLMSSADKSKLGGVETGAQKNIITSVQGRTGAVTISKSDVGLGDVNNVAITAAQVTKINELNYTKAMTQAQYDALSTAEKNRTDVWYGIYEE